MPSIQSLGSQEIVVIVSIAVSALLCILVLIATWRVYNKAGHGGWKCLIPIYNQYTLFKISWRPGMFWLAFFLFAIGWGLFNFQTLNSQIFQIAGIDNLMPIFDIVGAVMILISAAIEVVQTFKLSRAFGHGGAFGLGLFFLTPLFILILGFGRSQYEGPVR